MYLGVLPFLATMDSSSLCTRPIKDLSFQSFRRALLGLHPSTTEYRSWLGYLGHETTRLQT